MLSFLKSIHLSSLGFFRFMPLIACDDDNKLKVKCIINCREYIPPDSQSSYPMLHTPLHVDQFQSSSTVRTDLKPWSGFHAEYAIRWLCVPRHKDPGVELFGSHDHYEITVCWRSSSERPIEYRR